MQIKIAYFVEDNDKQEFNIPHKWNQRLQYHF